MAELQNCPFICDIRKSVFPCALGPNNVVIYMASRNLVPPIDVYIVQYIMH